MFEKEFDTISQLADEAYGASDVETQKSLLKKIQLEVNNLVAGFRNAGTVQTDEWQEDMNWVVEELGRRHPGMGIVWEKSAPELIKIAGYTVYVPHPVVEDARKKYPTQMEATMDRRWSLANYVERELQEMFVLPL